MIADPGDLVAWGGRTCISVQLVTKRYGYLTGMLLELNTVGENVSLRDTGCVHDDQTMLYRLRAHKEKSECTQR